MGWSPPPAGGGGGAVSSVFGRVGAVTANAGDYTDAKVTGSPTNVLTTTGDVLYASAANTLARLGVGSNGDVLTLAAGIPSWATPAAAPVTSVFSRTGVVTAQSGDYTDAQVTNSPTNKLTTTGDVLYASAANTLARLAIGTTGQVLAVVAGIPGWAASSTSTLTTTGDTLYASAANTLARLAIGTGGQYYVPIAGIPAWKTPASVQATPGNQTGTGSTAALVMLGLAAAITPAFSGRLLIVISGNGQSTVAADGGELAIFTGTGTAPTNGAAQTGSQRSQLLVMQEGGAGTAQMPFSINAVVTGLTIGTALWIDLAFAAVTGGTFTIQQVTVSAIEF